MENFLMNLLAVAAIIAMLYSVFAMWRNIDKELEKIEVGSKAAAVSKTTQVNASPIQSGRKISAQGKFQVGSKTVSGSTIKVSRKIAAQPIPA